MPIEYNGNLIQYAKDLRKRQTPQEKKLWYDSLAKYPVRFQRQKVIDNYIADFFCASAKLVIELDGGGHYTNEQMEYDAKRTRIFEQLGLLVVRFTNLDIDRNFYSVCTEIEKQIRKRLESLPQSPSGDSSPLKRVLLHPFWGAKNEN